MARVPAVTDISKDTPGPDPGPLDADAGALDVDAEVPADFDWDALPDDDEPMPYSDDEDAAPENPAYDSPAPDNRAQSPRDQSNREQRLPNGHASPPARVPKPPAPPSQSPSSRSDGVVADPMGVDSLEDGEIEQKFYKKKKKRKPAAERLHCDVCDIFVNGQITMDSHLKGQRHMTNARQAALRPVNKQISDHSKAMLSQNQPPREPRKPGDEWESSNAPPKPVSSPPSAPDSAAEHRNLSSRKEDIPRRRDPYALNNRDRPSEALPKERDRLPEAPQDDRRAEAPQDGRHSEASPDDPRSEVRDPRTTSRHPRLTSQRSQEERGEGSAKERDAEVRPGRDPYAVNRAQDPSEQRSLGNGLNKQNGVSQTQDAAASAADPKKRKRFDGSAEPGPVEGDRHPSNEDRDRRRSYEANGDGALRRKLSDGTRDPRQRDSYANREASRQPGPPVGPAPPHPSPPALVSAPAPMDTRDDRRPSDQARLFTYGSVRRESADDGSTLIPFEWLSQSMDTKEWRDLRHNTFSKGDDVDRLAFKMLQEILLSPVLGVSSCSLPSFSRGMLEAVRKQHLSPENDTYARFEEFPQELSVRNDNFGRGDPEWQKTQTAEQMAVRLVGDNIVFCLNSYEDNEAASSTEPHNFPRRGSFGQRNMIKSSRDGGLSPRYEDSVEQDRLFNELYDHLLRQSMSS